MSETGAFVLMVLMIIILILILCILFWQPTEAAAAERIEPECPAGTYDLRKIMELCWPELTAVMEKENLENGILLHWSGLSRNRKTVMLSVSAGNMMHACMNAASQICRDNAIPENDCWLMISENGRKKECVSEAAALLRQKGVSPQAVYEEGTGIIRGRYALFTVGEPAEAVLRAEGENTERFVSETAFPFVYSQPLKHFLRAVRKELPLMLRIQFALRGFTGRRPYRNLLRLFPEAADLLRSSLSVKEENGNTYLILRSPNAEEKEKALADLLRKSEMYGIRLYRESETDGSLYCDEGCEAWRSAQAAVRAVRPDAVCLPVISREGTGWPGWHTICFVPEDETERSAAEETAYYKRLIG